MKQTIKVNEQQLRRIIRESVRNILSEGMDDDFDERVYYSEELMKEMLQLSDNHTIWDIRNDFDPDEYYFRVERLLDELSERFGTKFYALGRSGRHICVDDTPENRERYDELVDAVKNAERVLIDHYNAEMAFDEAISRAIRKYLH